MVDDPSILKKLSSGQLAQLAAELREEIVQTVARTGGHLAASLGAVELTVALHTVFSSPRDKLLWDVGHQSYAHKLLTGRREVFHTLRQRKGISGFPKRSESPHDVFDVGHSSTAISTALGFAVARDLAGENHRVVAVVGDGALTGGLAFEGLNNAGQLRSNLIVVINDNEMSISSNVGALSAYLSRIRSAPTYSRVKADLNQALGRIPYVGPTVRDAAMRVKASVRHLVVPGALFEELGFTYLGPINGHDIAQMQEILRGAAMIPGPVMVHVLTRKGKGYAPAERDPDRYHGPGPFDRETGAMLSKKKRSFSDAFGDALVQLAEKDERVCAITAAMPGGTGLDEFARRFPQRFYDVGIAEQHAVTFAAGLAAGGLRPVVAIYSTFLQRAYDQIVHDICLQNLPVILAIDRAGLVGEDGETHQGQFDLSYLSHLPNLAVLAPANERDIHDMLAAATQLDGPCALRYPRGAVWPGTDLPSALPSHPLGGVILKRGKRVALMALGSMVPVALGAAQLLEEAGQTVTVVNARVVRPLDEPLVLELARRHQHIFTLEENAVHGGFGSLVMACLTEHEVDCRVKALGLPHRFIEHGKQAELRSACGLSSEAVAESVMRRLQRASLGEHHEAAP